MRKVPDESLWLGHVGDVRDLRALLVAGVTAVVDLALGEPLPKLPRDLVYCRFPVVDGPGNPAELLRLAVGTVAALVRARTPTLVYCSAGMSRSPAVVAAALAAARGGTPGEWLGRLAQGAPHDGMPGLWADVVAAVARDVRAAAPGK
jgi:hypothetical protein